MTATVSTAVAKVDKPTPGSMVASYRNDIASVLPSHVKPETWVRLAQGALKKGKKITTMVAGEKVTCTELELAAMNNLGGFMATVLDAARLGLEPGTEQYYLTPRKVKIGKEYRLEILGIVGYQGYIELMYRAGGISSIVAECVYTNDTFTYRPGRDAVPNHEIDWDADERGELRLVYSYAVMKDGATSKVVVLNRGAINKIKASSQGANSEYSPWKLHEPSMWLKSAVRQLAKWVPTSAEFRITPTTSTVPQVDRADFAPAIEGPKVLGDDWVEADVDIHDGEIVDDEPTAEQQPAPSQQKMAALHASLADCGVEEADRHATLGQLTGRAITSASQLTRDEATRILDVLARCNTADEPARALDAVLAEVGAA